MIPGRLARMLRGTPARIVYHRLKASIGATAQSDEHMIIERLAADAPPTFVEFGFHPTEFNCAPLARTSRGLLIDGDASTVALAQKILPPTLEARCRFLELDTLDEVIGGWLAGRQLGVLSIDVDGNDYWFLQALLHWMPAVISVEYNASFGSACISVPYDPAFERHAKHESGWYHGASLAAVAKLCAGHGYGLAAVSQAGGNAFFTKAGRRDAAVAWRPNALRNKWSKTNADEQWSAIENMPYVEV